MAFELTRIHFPWCPVRKPSSFNPFNASLIVLSPALYFCASNRIEGRISLNFPLMISCLIFLFISGRICISFPLQLLGRLSYTLIIAYIFLNVNTLIGEILRYFLRKYGISLSFSSGDERKLLFYLTFL